MSCKYSNLSFEALRANDHSFFSQLAGTGADKGCREKHERTRKDSWYVPRKAADYDDQRPTTNDQRPTTNDQRPTSSGWLVVAILAGLAACTTPNPIFRHKDAGGDDSGTIDPKTIVRVSPSGSDSADGVTAPVKTIKRAIEIAAGDGAIKTISLDTGRYNAANGEKYPYTLPTGVKLVGAAGTTLAGTRTEDGLVVDTGMVENLEFSDFRTALRATSTVTLASVTVKTSNVGVLAEGTANVQATALTVVGDAECKTIGVKATGMAQVAISAFVATDAVSLDGRDQSVISIANGTISSKPSAGCFPQMKMFGQSLTLSDTTISGGRGGLWLNHDRGVPFTKNELLVVKLMNATIADAGETAMISEAHDFQMTGGEIRNNRDFGAFLLGGGVQTFTGVGLKGNHAGIEVADPNIRLKVRGCTITGNKYGVSVDRVGSIDLGTAVDPGNNTILNSAFYGLYLNAPSGVMVFAAGNTWRPNTDGSDGSGKYGPRVITGVHDGGNFFINLASSSILL